MTNSPLPLTLLLLTARVTCSLHIPSPPGTNDRRTFVRDAISAAAVTTGASGAPQVAAALDTNTCNSNEAELFAAIQSELNVKKGPVRWNYLIGGSPSTSNDEADLLAPNYANIRYGTSTLASTRRAPCARSPPARYPDWMEGTWLATYKFSRATFPQGRGVLNLRVPGAGIGTVLSLPNIGYNPAPFTVRYLRNDGANANAGVANAGVYEDLAYNAPRRMEAFWPDAKVLSVRTGNSWNDKNDCKALATKDGENMLTPSCLVTGEGCTRGENPKLHSPATRLALDYEGPTRAGPRRGQTIDCSAIQSIVVGSAQEGEDGTPIATSKQFVQYNIQQELQTYYKEVCSFQRPSGSEPQVIEGNMRVAAFLPYFLTVGSDLLEPTRKYDESQALALYDYKITLKQICEEDASMI